MNATQAKDIMTTELVIGTPKMTFEEAIRILVNSRITGIPVLDEKHKLLGVVSEFDIIRAVDHLSGEGFLDLKLPIRYSRKATTIKEDTPLKEIIQYFLEKKLRRLLVLNNESKLVGVVTRRDIMRILYFRAKTEKFK